MFSLFRKGIILKICPNCNIQFETNNKNRIYCSFKCKNIIKQKRYWEKYPEKYKKHCKEFYKKYGKNYYKKNKKKCLQQNKKDNGTYRVWANMLQRCNNKNNPMYKNYGGRGIKVCRRWNKYENFKKDMGIKPDGLTIDRINNNGNYEPNNCKWTTWKQQRLNQRKPKNYIIKIKAKTIINPILKRYNHIIINIKDKKIFKNKAKASEYYSLTKQYITQLFYRPNEKYNFIYYKDL